MTSTQPEPEPEDLAVRLQHMDFKPMAQDDHKIAVYRALIQDDRAPGEPLYALTVTVASPRNDKEAQELKNFLSEMEAGFVLTAPNPEEDTADDREQPLPDFDLAKEALIQPELVRLRTLDGTFGVTVVVRTAVAEEEDSRAEEEDPRAAEFRSARGYQPVVARAYIRRTVLAGRDHRYTAKGGIPTATVTARYNSGSIRYPSSNITVGGGSRKATGKTVWVRGGTRACTYDFVGYFNGPFLN
jgi:hypothetical protein